MRYKNAGFTLIELLVAISILAIVAVLGWRGLDSIVRSRDVLTSELEQTRGLQLTFAQLQSDCSQNVNPLSYPNIPEGRTSWVEPERLIILRNEYSEDQAPSMQVVVYRLRNSELTRFESIPTRDIETLRQLLEQARNPPDNQVEIVMQKNVRDIEFTGFTGELPPQEVEKPNRNENNNDNNTPPNDSGKKDSKTDPQGKEPGVQPPGDGLQKITQTSVTTGLQVSLRLQDHDNKIIKIFMLGGA